MNFIRNVLLTLLTTTLFSISYAQANSSTNNYIVVLKPNAVTKEVATSIARTANGQVGYVYTNVFNGFSITVPETALKGITMNPNVSYVEEDIEITAFEQTIPTGIDRIFANTQELSINFEDDYRVDADVAVLDTGIDFDHPDLNTVGGTNCLSYSGRSPWNRTYYCDDAVSADDDHYHGTHVAGTIGALDNDFGVVGVAPGVRLWAVKVLDSSGSGSLSGIIAGIDWVVAKGNIEVINMSLGGSGQSNAMDAAIKKAFDSGVFVVVAAGNSNADSSGYTPANAPDAFTVSALADFDGLDGGIGLSTCRIDEDDTLANFSNWGEMVNMIAPGTCILSTYPLEKGSYNTISGTSMAAPHVAGAAALLSSTLETPSEIKVLLTSYGNYDWLDSSTDGTQEPLLDINYPVFIPKLIAVNSVIDNISPTADFSFQCSERSCEFDATDSQDSDGTIASYAWNFGDSESGSTPTISHTFAADGTYEVTLIVTDNEGATDNIVRDVTVVTGGDSPSLVFETFNTGKYWYVEVSYNTNDPITGTWTEPFGTCSGSVCTSNNIPKKQSSIVFEDNNGNSLTIYKP